MGILFVYLFHVCFNNVDLLYVDKSQMTFKIIYTIENIFEC